MKLLNQIKEYKRLKAIKAIESERSVTDDFYGKVMCLFASPRGGSTWLLETLMRRTNFVPINEPFFQGKLRVDGAMPSFFEGRPYLKNLKYWYHQPIVDENETDEDKENLRKIFSGKYLNPILTPYSNLAQLRKAEKFIIKFCYGNLMLPWIVNHFNVAAIFLVRHPCAVIASQLNVAGAFDYVIKHPGFSLPTFKNSNYFSQFDAVLSNLSRPEEILAAIWCITISHVINHADHGVRWHTVRYEDLLHDPAQELLKIEKRFPEFGWSDGNWEQMITPSKTTLDENLKNHLLFGTQEEKWKDQLSKRQIENTLSVVKAFDIKLYSS
ncbi:MAG: sulfotransferase domain-containing protein [Cyclobacteriaceae bacterium]